MLKKVSQIISQTNSVSLSGYSSDNDLGRLFKRIKKLSLTLKMAKNLKNLDGVIVS